MKSDPVLVRKGVVPPDYHCQCEFCRKVIGELRPEGEGYYSRLERNKYYAPIERGKGGHIAKTPLHIARWAIQAYTDRGDWVLDPTIGAGTTAVEALTQGRSVAGMELEYGRILQANVEKALEENRGVRAAIQEGDARGIGKFLKKTKKKYRLVVNNPPYSGDVSMPSPAGKLRGKEHRHLETTYFYDKGLPNLAFLREGSEYWETLRQIYSACIDWLEPGGHFVIGVKDMIRKKEPFLLHRDLCVLLDDLGLEFVGTAFLRHHPGTLFLNTYHQRYGVHPPYYQTINVFRRG